jgi:unsaturated chondroitin disaccharide hydrolase
VTETSIDLDKAIGTALATIDRNLATFADIYPHDTTVHGIYSQREARKGYPPGSHTGWTTGFWAGMLWLAYELTRDDMYKRAAEVQVERFTDRLERKIDVDHHDIGFLYTLSCVAAWRLTHNQHAKRTALKAADQLMTRFLEKPGILQAWGSLDDPEQRGRSIVDSLMNLPLLFWASEHASNPRYEQAARRHAEQLMRYCVRPDGSTFHTYYFDVDSGAPKFGNTHQGHTDESTWSRGQAWAVYGFALAYRYTREKRFLDVARRVADVFLANTPKDNVVYWDFDFADGSAEPKDSSASAIAVCGLLELGEHTAAQDILEALISTCTQGNTENALLLHGTQNRNTDTGVDEANLWGDYFYLEALTRLKLPDWTPYW